MRYLTGAVACVIIAVGLSVAQQLYVGPTSSNPRWATASDFDGSIIFCRGYYSSVRAETEGIGWWTDYPGSEHNFMVRLAELTEVQVRFDPNRIPFYVVVALDDPLIFKCPMVYLADAGTIGFREAEVENLRSYLTKGGFIWADDFWGSAAWDQWESEIRRVLPSGRFPMRDLPSDHPIFRMLYSIEGGIWQQPHAEFWYGYSDGEGEVVVPPGSTSERGDDSRTPTIRGIEDERGQVVVLSTHNTDIGDGWEREQAEYREYVETFSARSYALGVNIFLYALTH